MLNNATGFDRIYIACGYTDLRQGIDGLTAVIRRQLGVDPFQKNVLFLLCGRKPDKIKCLIWEGDGFLLLYKRLLDMINGAPPKIGAPSIMSQGTNGLAFTTHIKHKMPKGKPRLAHSAVQNP